MAEMMKAYVFEDVEKAVYKEIAIPEIGPDECLVQMKASGICHSDYELLAGRYIVPFSYPITPGHEWSGEVVKVGVNVTSFKAGDRVVGECVWGCNTCLICQSGEFTYCPTADHFGFTANGAMAEYTAVLAKLLHKVPANIDYKTASMLEPFTVAYNGIHGIGGVDAADTVVVIGGGNIGLHTAAAAKAMGARVIIVEPQDYRRDVAMELGADFAFDPINEDAVTKIKELTNGYGADLVIECSGSKAGYIATLDYVKNSGRISFVGINIGQEMPVEMGKFQIKGITSKGFIGSPYVWDRALAFISQSKLDLSPIASHTFTLDHIEDAYAFARDLKNKPIKVIVENNK